MAFDALKVRCQAIKESARKLVNEDKELIGWISAVFVLATLVIVFFWVGRGADKASCWYRVGQGLAIFWAIAPPIYFFIEWWFWVPENANAKLDERKFEFEKFRYTQEIATKFWIGLAGSLAVLFLASK